MEVIFIRFVLTVLTVNYISVTYGLKVIPERAKVTYVNTKYIEWGKLRVVRYGRKSDYYMNLEGVTKHTWANNITIHFGFLEFLHNEYKQSFVDLKYKFCDFYETDVYIGVILHKIGLTCPLPQGEYHLMNLTAPTQEFPNVFPFEKGRVDLEFTVTATGELMGTAYIIARFVN